MTTQATQVHAPGAAGGAALESAPPSLCIILPGEKASPMVWTESPGERLRRQFAAKGVVRDVAPDQLDREGGPVLLLRGDAVLDAPLIEALAARPGALLRGDGDDGATLLAAHAPAGRAAAAARLLSGEEDPASAGAFQKLSPTELSSDYWQALRKREKPYALCVTEENRRRTEWRMFMGTYKGATDFVTKWLWPRPAFHITKLCARLGISPNAVTYVSLVLVFAALYWFWTGDWFLGLAAGWLMTFLDTVDGKLARITLTSSKFGNALDHGIDLIHPPFWYLAWGLGLAGGPLALTNEQLIYAMVLIFAGYILQRVIEGLSILFFKIEIHVWRPIDSLFRQITARRNPNLVLLTISALAGRPDLGLWAVVIWTTACLFLHCLQLIQAWLIWRRDGQLVSWMAKSTAAP